MWPKIVKCRFLSRLRRVGPHQEELGTVAAGAAICHRHHPFGVRLGPVRLVGELVARTTFAGPARVSTLQDEDPRISQPMTFRVVEVALLGKGNKGVDRARRHGPIQCDRDGAIRHREHIADRAAGRHASRWRRRHRPRRSAGEGVLADVAPICRHRCRVGCRRLDGRRFRGSSVLAGIRGSGRSWSAARQYQ